MCGKPGASPNYGLLLDSACREVYRYYKRAGTQPKPCLRQLGKCYDGPEPPPLYGCKFCLVAKVTRLGASEPKLVGRPSSAPQLPPQVRYACRVERLTSPLHAPVSQPSRLQSAGLVCASPSSSSPPSAPSLQVRAFVRHPVGASPLHATPPPRRVERLPLPLQAPVSSSSPAPSAPSPQVRILVRHPVGASLPASTSSSSPPLSLPPPSSSPSPLSRAPRPLVGVPPLQDPVTTSPVPLPLSLPPSSQVHHARRVERLPPPRIHVVRSPLPSSQQSKLQTLEKLKALAKKEHDLQEELRKTANLRRIHELRLAQSMISVVRRPQELACVAGRMPPVSFTMTVENLRNLKVRPLLEQKQDLDDLHAFVSVCYEQYFLGLSCPPTHEMFWVKNDLVRQLRVSETPGCAIFVARWLNATLIERAKDCQALSLKFDVAGSQDPVHVKLGYTPKKNERVLQEAGFAFLEGQDKAWQNQLRLEIGKS